MIHRLLNTIQRIANIPALIERRNVLVARARMTELTPEVSHSINQKQLLVDVSVIQRHDAGTGIQRIVRAVLKGLSSDPSAAYVVRLVAATRKQPYRYIDWDGAEGTPTWEGDVIIQPGDIFLGLDLSAHIIPYHHRQLAEWKKQGVGLHFIVYDLLPLQRPEWFSRKLVVAFRRWIKAVAILADSAICISRTVEADLVAWLEKRYCLAAGTVPSQVIPMGWDFAAAKSTIGLPFNFGQILQQVEQRRTALMVGTLEPRKGHRQVLAAFESLWLDGKDYNLIIVGRPGWKTEVLQAKLRNHPQRNQRLFWLDDASDEALLMLYRRCDGLIIASQAEGFGLPLIEALGHRMPVLARDIPIFREISRGAASFFSSDAPGILKQEIRGWLDSLSEEERLMVTPTSWKDSVQSLLSSIGAKQQSFK